MRIAVGNFRALPQAMNAGIAKTAFVLAAIFILAQEAFCAVLPAGKVVWWGRDEFWKQYYSKHTNGVIEEDDEIISNVVAIAANTWQGLLLKEDGTVIGIGTDFYGGNEVPAGLSNVISIAAEMNSNWAIRQDGTVARWGRDKDDANIIAGLTNIVSVTWAGYENYLALKNDGTVLGFRFDNSVPLIDPATGRPSKYDNKLFHQVKVHGEILSNVVAIASMNYTPLILKTDSTVYNLGYQTPGAPVVQPRYEAHDNVLYEYLGAESAQLPYQYTAADPVIIDGQCLSNVMSLASGEGHILALKSDGKVIAWGNNNNGAETVPAGLDNVVAIAATGSESMALKHDGTVVAWGNNDSGQTSVPVGMSNVVAIASAGDFSLAITTGNIPSSVFVTPHGQLEEMEREADLIFKGRVISSTPITNAPFPDWGKSHDTRLEVISVLKGNLSTKAVDFLHLTHGPNFWSGPAPPPNFALNVGESYIIFAVNAEKPDWLYTPSSNYVARADVFRQLMKGEVPTHTLDSRPLGVLPVKEAHWCELNLLLNDSNPTNQLYAIEKLDSLSFAGRQDDQWRHSEDFKRINILCALLPLVTNQNEKVASRAINCFATESNAAAVLEPFARALIKVADDGASSSLRLDAINALSGTQFEAVSNSLTELLENSDENIRSRAIGLLMLYPGDFSEQTLRRHATDESPKIRAAVADAIGNGKIAGLLPTLQKLLSDPGGLTNPVSPLTIEAIQDSGQIWGNNTGDVHTSAGFALLKFDADQVSNILTANLDDHGFRPSYLCKLAEKNPEPWLTNLVEILEARRDRIWKEVEASGVDQKTNYFEARMALAGIYSHCWNLVYKSLVKYFR
jgi:hypothetical protein